MLVKRIVAYTHLSSSVYELWRDIGLKLQLFPTPLHLHYTEGVPIRVPGKSLDLRKLESWGYQAVKTV